MDWLAIDLEQVFYHVSRSLDILVARVALVRIKTGIVSHIQEHIDVGVAIGTHRRIVLNNTGADVNAFGAVSSADTHVMMDGNHPNATKGIP